MRLAFVVSGGYLSFRLCTHGRCTLPQERRCAPMETQFAIVVYRRRWNGFLILLCSLALLFPSPATGSGHSRASLYLSSSGSLHLPLAALTVAVPFWLLPKVTAKEQTLSQAKYALRASWLEVGPGRYIVIKDQRKTPCFCMVSFFGIRRLPIFPGRLQPSIVGV